MKRIAICCDGTWNRPDQMHDGELCPSNVTKIASCIAPIHNGVSQLVFYDKGVGTGRFDRLLGGACGWGIKRKILDVYRFLIATYQPEDELYFFGFSRGAYTVRSTFGLIRNSGLLKPEFTLSAQMVDATLAWSLLAGVWNPRVFLGRWFKSSSTWSSCS